MDGYENLERDVLFLISLDVNILELEKEKINEYPFSLKKICETYFIDLEIPGRYTLFKNKEREIVLKVWGQEKLDFHFHPEKGCVFKILEGYLLEKRKHPDIEKEECFLREKQETVYINNMLGPHSICNCEKTVSIHLYAF